MMKSDDLFNEWMLHTEFLKCDKCCTVLGTFTGLRFMRFGDLLCHKCGVLQCQEVDNASS